jgi:hypothetical protein
MKKSIGLTLALLLGMAFLLPSTFAAEDEPEAAAEVTQLQLADILINVLGLTRMLPADPTPQEKFSVLMTNGVVPEEGWKPAEVVTKATLARLVVQAMGRASEIENPDDPNSWVNYLKENGIPIDTIGQAADNVEPLAEPVADFVVRRSASADPMSRQSVFGKPDERTFGTDVDMSQLPVSVTQQFVDTVIAAAAVTPPRRRPTTPTGGDS